MAEVAPGADWVVGRDDELAIISRYLDRIRTDGQALLFSGEPGVGKTVLLDLAERAATGAGMRTLQGSGVEFETDLAYSGLHQLLVPLSDELDRLPMSARAALEVALGIGDGTPPDRLVVSNATLSLLNGATRDAPLLVVVDDVQWLDRATAAALGFVARRLVGTRLGFLGAFRSGSESFFTRAGLSEREVRPLDDRAALELISRRFPTMSPRGRRRVVEEARGNPLALIELPATVDGARHAQPMTPGGFPSDRRVQGLYASRVTDLPGPTRKLLLIAALDGTEDLALLHAAAAEDHRRLDDLGPAELAQLVAVHERVGRIAFRHPLIKAAVVEQSTHDERRTAHLLLAHIVDQPERRAMHLADAAVMPDEDVASALQHAAGRVLGRGDAVGAITALIRAADLSPNDSDKSRRLADAAYVGAQVTGELGTAARLLSDARRIDPAIPDSLEAAVATAYLLLNDDGDAESAHRLVTAAIESTADDHQGLVEALYTLVLVCHFGGRPEQWVPFRTAIDRIGTAAPVALRLLAETYADPITASPAALDAVDLAVAGLRGEVDPALIVRTAIAAFYVDRLSGCQEALWRVVHDGREGGAVGSSMSALLMLTFNELHAGRWTDSKALADEGIGLCEEHGYRLFAWPGRYALALLAGVQGDCDTVGSLTDAMEAWAAPRGLHRLIDYARHARALAALGQGAFETAYQEASRISPAGGLTSHAPQALWVGMDLVDAAMHTNRRAEARAHAFRMRDAGMARLSPRCELLVAGSLAMVADDGEAGELFEHAVSVHGALRWPFELARVRLAYGERLRRSRSISAARTELTSARTAFEALGATPWFERASNELAATGRKGHSGQVAVPGQLTAQEREVALLAATGMTNKAIANQLYLSPRTVSAHLYRVFPKLGIRSRAAIRDALMNGHGQP